MDDDDRRVEVEASELRIYDEPRAGRMKVVNAKNECEYFAGCDHEVEGIYDHPILGELPVCRRCIRAVGIDDSAVRWYCEECGSTDGVTFEPDPYQEELYGDMTPVALCARCHDESSAEI